MTGASTAALAALRERYLRAQLAGDRREAVRLAVEDGLGVGFKIEQLQEAVIAEAQREIGRLWQLNLVTVAQEHMASAISQLVLAVLFERSPPGRRLGRRIVVACVEGELHDLPARLVADTLEHAGFDVDFLGANVPPSQLCAHIAQVKPDLIALSITMSFHLPALRAALAELASASSVPILVGGHALGWSTTVAAELGVDTCEASATALVAHVSQLTGLDSVQPT